MDELDPLPDLTAAQRESENLTRERIVCELCGRGIAGIAALVDHYDTQHPRKRRRR